MGLRLHSANYSLNQPYSKAHFTDHCVCRVCLPECTLKTTNSFQRMLHDSLFMVYSHYIIDLMNTLLIHILLHVTYYRVLASEWPPSSSKHLMKSQLLWGTFCKTALKNICEKAAYK